MIKIMLPSFLLKFLRKVLLKRAFYLSYSYDAKRFIKYSNLSYPYESKTKLLGYIIASYHVVEKGLSMPEMKLGFGQDRLLSLIEKCIVYKNRYGIEGTQFMHALGVIKEYKHVHDEDNYKLDEYVILAIKKLLTNVPNVPLTKQIGINRDEYFKYINSSFDKFSKSRHSLRNFEGEITATEIGKAIQLAQNAPSSCNRQPSRVYIIENKNKITQILELQNGNRGFGYLSNKLIVLTSELGGYLGINERNYAFVDGGIYAMNLLYALHYYQIGACTLNWCYNPDNDKIIRKICNIPHSEVVLLIIACGGVPEKFKLTLSKRNDSKQIIKIL